MQTFKILFRFNVPPSTSKNTSFPLSIKNIFASTASFKLRVNTLNSWRLNPAGCGHQKPFWNLDCQSTEKMGKLCWREETKRADLIGKGILSKCQRNVFTPHFHGTLIFHFSFSIENEMKWHLESWNFNEMKILMKNCEICEFFMKISWIPMKNLKFLHCLILHCLAILIFSFFIFPQPSCVSTLRWNCHTTFLRAAFPLKKSWQHSTQRKEYTWLHHQNLALIHKIVVKNYPPPDKVDIFRYFWGTPYCRYFRYPRRGQPGR